MKIANCKYCGAYPSIYIYPEYNNIYCQQCIRDTFYSQNPYEQTEQEAIKCWNSLNTDQHGQQIKRQTIDWIEWDGDVEHLPEPGTVVLIKRESNLPKLCRIRRRRKSVYMVDLWNDDGSFWGFEKGDMFAVVE